MSFVSDTFTDTAAVLVENHTGETGASWTKHGFGTGTAAISDANRARCTSAGASLFYASGIPTDADYRVLMTLTCKSAATGIAGICGRVATGANTWYQVRHVNGTGWRLSKIVTGTETVLVSGGSASLSAGVDYEAELRMTGSTISIWIDGVQIGSDVTDSDITAAGRVGIRFATSSTDTTRYHIDKIDGTEPPNSLTYSENPAAYTVGTAIAANNPTSGGGAPTSYTVAPALPTGLSLNAGTGVITGTPTVATAQATYVVTATNAAGSTTANLVITVNAAAATPAGGSGWITVRRLKETRSLYARMIAWRLRLRR